jgi:hypothetical protein
VKGNISIKVFYIDSRRIIKREGQEEQKTGETNNGE